MTTKGRLEMAGGTGVAGALLGLKFGGPVGAAIGAAVGAALGALIEPVVASHAIIPPSAFQALTGIFHPAQPTLAAQVRDGGTAKPAATSLYGYLKAHGPDGSPALSQFVTVFQQLSNTDPHATQLTGPLNVTRVYDPATAAALTLYTNDPIASASPPAPQPMTVAQASDAYVPGAAANSGYNLYTYLKKSGNDRSANLQRLVHQFQIDVNSDPKFPGPAAPAARIIAAKLGETGTYDAATSKALAVMSNDPVSP